MKWLNDEDENDDEDDRMESKMTTKIDEDSHIGVSKNRDTPKSSILIGFSMK